MAVPLCDMRFQSDADGSERATSLSERPRLLVKSRLGASSLSWFPRSHAQPQHVLDIYLPVILDRYRDWCRAGLFLRERWEHQQKPHESNLARRVFDCRLNNLRKRGGRVKERKCRGRQRLSAEDTTIRTSDTQTSGCFCPPNLEV